MWQFCLSIDRMPFLVPTLVKDRNMTHTYRNMTYAITKLKTAKPNEGKSEPYCRWYEMRKEEKAFPDGPCLRTRKLLCYVYKYCFLLSHY